MTTNQYRQGDVLITKTDTIPDGAETQKRENGLCVLARGEATGHHHAIRSRHAQLLAVAGMMYLRCLREVTLRHQEHGPIVLPAGDYLVKRQREYSPEVIRNVAD